MSYIPQELTEERLEKALDLLRQITATGSVPDRIKYYYADLLAEVIRNRSPETTVGSY